MVNIIVFYVYIFVIIFVIIDQCILVYDVVKVNNGNGYNFIIGVFVVLEIGVYVFIWIIREVSNCYYLIQLMVNVVEMGIIYFYLVVDGDFLVIGIVVIYVNVGDDVYVRMYELWNYCFIVSNDVGKLLFVGWKLF